MKSPRLKLMDFETWHSWNLPDYASMLNQTPGQSIQEYREKKDNLVDVLWFLTISLCVTLVVTHWEKLTEWAKILFKEDEAETVSSKEISEG